MLVARAGALGDLLLLRPAIAALRASGREVGLLAPPPGDVLVGHGPSEVRERIDWDHPGLSALLAGSSPKTGPAGSFASRLDGYEAVLAVTASDELLRTLRRLVARVVPVPPRPPEGPPVHASAAALEAARTLGGGRLRELPVLLPRPDDEAGARNLLADLPEGFLAVHPGSGSARKNWPWERFAALAERVSPTAPFLVVEGPADAESVANLRGLCPRARVACGLSLRTLGALLRRAGLYVGNDSGVSHLAAAFGAPTLALFGPTSAAVWAPLGPRVRAVSAPHGRLEALEPATVAREAEALRCPELADLQEGGPGKQERQ